ncbi:MAG TPA: LysR substrate-binding domain-containing protein [Chloroflexota bacterium]|nr:LysR substrate-binding domain-containing protein [Chloroflexota bacterium]
MNLHQLRVFYTVANRLSFTLAAEDLVMSQPAASLQVKALEQSLRLRLFERVNNRLNLTQAGEALYRSAVIMLSAEDEATRTMAELAGATRGKLVIGANTTGGMYIMPPVIRDFRKRYRETEIVLHIDGTERLCERVQQNIIDLAFVGGPIEDSRFRVEHLCLDPLALIFSPAHPFAGKTSVALTELAAEEFVVPEPSSRTRLLVERSLRQRGLIMKIGQQLTGTEPVKKAVESNLGVGIVSSHAVGREIAAGHLATAGVDGLALQRYFEMISRSDKYFPPAGMRFREFVSEYLK